MPFFWNDLWLGNGGTSSATTPIYTAITSPTATTSTILWSQVNNAATWVTTSPGTDGIGGSIVWYDAHSEALLQQQAQHAWIQQAGQERYNFAITRPSGLGSLFMPSRPAIITHQEEIARDRALFTRAMAEHNEQEAERLLRQIERHEHLAAEERRAVEERAQRHREEQERREQARAVARELLLEHLSPAQRETFIANGWFIVEGGRSKTQYRIRAAESMNANVDVLHEGRTRHRLCAHVPLGTVPLGDQLLAQKIMLELAEDDFLRKANRHVA